MAWTKKGVLGIGIALAILVGIGIGLTFYVPYRIQRAINEKLESLKKKGYDVSYDMLRYQLIRGTLEIQGLVVRKTGGEAGCKIPESFAARDVQAKGFNIVSILFHDDVDFTSIEFASPRLVVKENTKFLPDTTLKRTGRFTMTSAKVRLNRLRIQYLDSVGCQVNGRFFTNLQVNQVELHWSEDKPVRFVFGQANASGSRIELPSKLYSFTIKELSLDLTKHTLDVDSIRINPTLGKLAFGRTKGFESDRIVGTIPYVRLRGLKLNYDDTLIISTKQASIQMFLRVFRDKRLPFKKVEKPLPVQFLQQLAFGISIDTLEIKKSYVEYEEYAKGAATSGTVFFDDLHAVIYNINNDAREFDGKTVMFARANLMGEADLRVRTEFPWNNSRKCLIEGTLQDLSLTKVNSLMQAVTNVKAESGKLKKLTFHFAYNAIRSDGKLELNYRDLKLITYKDDDKVSKRLAKKRKEKLRKVNKEENKLKSWILNNFIIRKNVDEKDPEEKRTGTINFYRNVHRSVFNYWWKSLLSGLRSAFDLDRFNDRDNRKNRKKQKPQN
jgi:hypothetical protein